jgi:hypothetical protein
MAEDVIGLYLDPAGTNCAMGAARFGPMTVNVVHHSEIGTRVGKFKVNDASGLFLAGTGVTAGFVSIGTYAAGIEIGYPTCRTGATLIGTLNYFLQNEALDCSRTVQVVPHPGSEVADEVIAVGCQQPFGTITVATGGRLWGGTDAELCGGCTEPPLATQESTWGGIKALYR